MPGLLPTDSDAALSDKIRVLDRARIATYSYALRQMDHVHPILAGWRTAFAHIGESGKIGIPAAGLMHQTQREPTWFEGARVVGFGRAAGADAAHLRPLQFGETAASGKGIPVEALLGVAPDRAPHLGRQAERLCSCGN